MCLFDKYPIGSTNKVGVADLTCYNCGYVFDKGKNIVIKSLGHKEIYGDLMDDFEYAETVSCPSCNKKFGNFIYPCLDGSFFYIDERELVEANRQ